MTVSSGRACLPGRDSSQVRAIVGNYLRAVEEFRGRTEAQRLPR